MAERKQIDWEAVEKEYCLGQKTNRTIAEEYGCSHTAVQKRAKKEGWVQDKTAEIRDKTNAALVGFQDEVSKEVSRKVSTVTPEQIDVAVQSNVEIILSHRQDIKKLRDLISALVKKIEEALEAGDVVDPKDINTLATTIKNLTTAEKEAIGMERQAFNIDDRPGAGTGEDVVIRVKIGDEAE